MSTFLFAFAFALKLVIPTDTTETQYTENQRALDARAASTYIIDTTELGGCDNSETEEVNECDDGGCMGYGEDGAPLGCTLMAAIGETGNLGGGDISFGISGTFNTAMAGALPKNVNMDGAGKDVTLVAESPYYNPPIILIAAGNNTIQGVDFSCTSSQAKPQQGLSMSSLEGQINVGTPGSSGAVRIAGCDIGISSVVQNTTTNITNTTLVNNRLAINIVGSPQNIIKDNFIGVEADGRTPNGNTEGLKVLPMWSSNTIIEGNVIAGNSTYGVQLVGKLDSELLRNVKLRGNFIGVATDSTTKIPNGTSGIEIVGPARDIVIGEDAVGNGQPNVIASNGGHGIRLMAYEDTGNGLTGGPERVTILKNIIKDNQERGIYASPSVALPEKPTLQELVVDTTAANPDTLYGTASPGDRVDLYFTDAPPDDQGAGEGEKWIRTVFADSNGTFKTTVDDMPPAVSCSDARAYTATVTDSLGSTSVFADNYQLMGGILTSQYREIFLKDVPLENKYTVKANWGNTPVDERLVTIRINQANPWKILRDAPDEFAFMVDMGDTPLQAIQDNEIEVRLSGCLGSAKEVTQTVPVVKTPDWIETDKIEVLPKGDHVIYRYSWKIPEEPIRASVTIPSEVPYWSGLWGLDETQFTAHFDASSLGGETMGLIEGQSAFGLGPYVKIGINTTGTTKLGLTSRRLGPYTGDLELDAAGSVTFQKSICIPTPFGVDIGCLKGSLTGALDVTYNAPFEYDREVIWKDGQGTGHPSLSGNVEASISWPVSISMGVTVDGTAVVNFGPPDNLNLNGTGNVVMTPHISAFDENYSTEIELFDFSFGGSAKRSVVFDTQQKVWANAANQEDMRSAIPLSATVSDNGTVAIAGVVSGNNNTRDIMVRFKKEGQSETSLKITEKNGRNLYPSATFDGNGNLLVVWMHSDDAPPQTLEEVVTYAGSFDLSYAVVDVGSETVTETGSLTNDNQADMDPTLVLGSDGSVLLAWASLTGDFGGSDTEPMHFRSKLWSGGQWQAEITAAENVANVTSWDAAHLDSQTSFLTFTVDESGQGNSSTLMAANRTGGSWESPTALADDGRMHAAVHTDFESSGKAKLVWARDSMLVAASATSPAAFDTVFSIIPDDYSLLAAGELTATKGRFFFGWPGSQGPEFVTDSSDTWTQPKLLDGFDTGSRSVSITAAPSNTDSAKVFIASLDYTGDAPVTQISSNEITFGEQIVTSSGHHEEDAGGVIPDSFELQQNYPNPFNPTTQIPFSLPKSSHVKLTVYDILGREVASLVNDNMKAGQHTIRFNGHNLSSGIYLYRLTTDEFTQTKQLILLK